MKAEMALFLVVNQLVSSDHIEISPYQSCGRSLLCKNGDLKPFMFFQVDMYF